MGATCGTLSNACGGSIDCGVGQAACDDPSKGLSCVNNFCVCTPESDCQLCAQLAATGELACGTEGRGGMCGNGEQVYTATDRCGTQRSVRCCETTGPHFSLPTLHCDPLYGTMCDP